MHVLPTGHDRNKTWLSALFAAASETVLELVRGCPAAILAAEKDWGTSRMIRVECMA